MNVKVRRLRPDAVIPEYKNPGDAGFDFYALEEMILLPGETKRVSTGLAFEIPEGYELQIRPRSGLSDRTKIRISNSPGTIDSGYRGEVQILVDNISFPKLPAGYEFEHSPFVVALNGEFLSLPDPTSNLSQWFPTETYLIRKGDRIAQGIIVPVERATFVESDVLSDTKRGESGFGSTGVS